MNIDRNKIIKSLMALAALFLIVGGLAKIRQINSLTLTEYAAQHTGQAETEETEGIEDITDNTSTETDDSDSVEITKETDLPEIDDSDGTTENLQDGTETTPISTLTGAILNADDMKEQRITYIDSFYYEPLSDNLRRYITGVSFPATSRSIDETATEDGASAPQGNVLSENDLAITYDELRYVHILHYDFDGNLAEGELICNEFIAQDLVEIFYELYRNEYQLEKVHLIDEYDGDDTVSMENNNTSCFNYRLVEGSTSLSKHALGLAIDVNPLYNPYITYEKDGSEKVSPAIASAYADRTAAFPYKIDESDLCYKLFTEHGFTWGGNWNSCKDYQHFQKVP